MFKILFLLSFLFIAVISNEKVNITVAVETLCPCAGQWQYDFMKYVVPTVGEIINYERLFDGTAHSNGSVTVWPHAYQEVLGNML